MPNSRWESLGPTGRLILPLHVGRLLPPLVALSCYFDESFDEQVHVVAGYISSADVWDRVFIPAWQGVIDGAPHRINEFSAGDCFHGRKAFDKQKGWTRPQREELSSRFVSVIIESRALVGVAAAFCIPGKADPVDPRATRYRNDTAQAGYGICLGLCFANLFPIVAKHREIEEIRPVVDARNKFSERLMMNFDFAMRFVDPSVADRVRRPVPDDSKKVLPLQAADLLARETFMEVWARSAKQPARPLLERLVEGAPHGAYCISYPSLESYQASLDDRSKHTAYSKVLFRSGLPLRSSGSWNVP